MPKALPMHEHQLQGTVDKVLFHNQENGYAIFILALGSHQSATIQGYVSALHPGEQLVVQGDWVNHPKFGKQFQATSCTIHTPNTVIGLKKYLSSGLIKGIGPVYAERLINAFGIKVLEVIDNQPELLHTVPGIGKGRADAIIKAWQDQKEVSHIMVFLQEKDISPAYAVKIFKEYGQESIAVITENPYRLADDIWGIGFKVADQIAQKAGIAPDSIKRVKAALIYALNQNSTSGHLYGEIADIKKEASSILELKTSLATSVSAKATTDTRDERNTTEPFVASNCEAIVASHTTSKESIDTREQLLLKNALHQLHDEQKIKVISLEDKHYIGLAHHYMTEKNVATRLKKLLEMPSSFHFELNAIYQQLRAPKSHEIALNEEQQKGVLSCLQHKISIITGGPGTGKTTLVKKLLNILDEHSITYRLAAPTGRAAKRISEGTGRYGVTIHRLLEYDVSRHGFAKNESDALKLDMLIIDEASMLDIFLMHALLKALPYQAHLVLIGDSDQLPSVGSGNVLADLITSKKIPTIQLKEIFRQARDSMIIVNAHRINAGEFPLSSQEGTKKDFIFIKENDPTLAFEHIKTLYATTLKKHFLASDDAMVLVPMNRGIVGTHKLNHDLQALLNPNPEAKELAFQLYRYKVGDRVMQIRNNYDNNVFNGDTGIIEDINLSDRITQVRFYDRLIAYEASELDELVLAYAISIHKSQGSEYPAVIIPLFMQHFTLLQRNLVYTAITRAKKLCILIGQPKALAIALRNTKGSTRTTFLKHYLTSDLQCR